MISRTLLLVSLAFGLGACNTAKTDLGKSDSGAQAAQPAPAVATGDGTNGATPPTISPAPSQGALRIANLTSVDTNAQEGMASNFTWGGPKGGSSLHDYRGKVVVINFWGTWCPPCRRELPALISLHKELGEKDVQFIGVNVGEEEGDGMSVEQRVSKFAEDAGIAYPLVLANEEIVTAYGGIEAVPTTFVVGRDGKIVEKLVGGRDEQTFRNAIQKAL